MRKQSIVAMALAIGVLAGVSGHVPFTDLNKAEASTQMGQYKFTAEQQEALREINNLRKIWGNPFEATLDARLNEAALGHAKYIDIHGTTHTQIRGNKGFTGVDYNDRAKAQGYTESVFEVYSTLKGADFSILKGLEFLLDSPQHRETLMTPHYSDLGVGKTSSALVLLYSSGSWDKNQDKRQYNYSPSVYPYNNQTGVPTSIQLNRLTYDPTGIKAKEAGYAVSVQVPYLDRDASYNIELYDNNGARVDVYMDKNKAQRKGNSIYIVPKKPLKSGETYKAKATFTIDSAETLEWSFTTSKFDATKFPDYKEYQYWAKTFEWAINNNIIYGGLRNGKTYLDPDVNLTETQMLSVFFRYFKPSELTSTQKQSTWMHDVNYQLATKYGLPVKAKNNSTANRTLADKAITRGQFAQVMATMHHGKPMAEKESVEFLLSVGLSNQKDYADFQPNMTLSRAHAVTFLQRYNTIFNNGK